jgi:YfiH family protein
VSLAWITPEWPTPPRVRALSTLRTGGTSAGRYASLNLGDHVGDSPAAVAENRRRLAAAAELPAAPVWLRQVHGAHVADLDAPVPSLNADAACTRQPGRVCAILTADCVPVLLAADRGGVVAAAHAGWRGLSAGVLAATVRAAAVAPQELIAWIGPCIGRRHYEVGSEVRDALLHSVPGAAAAFQANSRGRYLANLALLARLQLESLGLTGIYGGSDCTYADANRYFSHRRDGQTGRQATLIWLEPVLRRLN